MTTAPGFSAPRQATGTRRFRATIVPLPGVRFTLTTAALFEGLAIILVDGKGEPAGAGTGIGDLQALFKTPPLAIADTVFTYVEDVELRGDGDAVRFEFEPVGHSGTAASGIFREMLRALGVTEVIDIVRGGQRETE